MTCTQCGRTLDESARFCPHCGQLLTTGATVAPFVPERLIRPREGRMIAGVCAGFALRYGWDVALVRLVLVLAAIFGVGTPVLAYLIAWIVMPNGQYSLPLPVSPQTGSQPGNQTGAGPGSMTV